MIKSLNLSYLRSLLKSMEDKENITTKQRFELASYNADVGNDYIFSHNMDCIFDILNSMQETK